MPFFNKAWHYLKKAIIFFQHFLWNILCDNIELLTYSSIYSPTITKAINTTYKIPIDYFISKLPSNKKTKQPSIGSSAFGLRHFAFSQPFPKEWVLRVL